MAARWLLICLISFLDQTAHAQIGFNQVHDFDQIAISWGSVILSNDTITIYGGIHENDHPAFGLLFSQFDTSGNLIRYKVYNDSLGDNVVRVFPNSFIKLDHHRGYAGIGGIYERIFGILALYNMDGSIRKVVEYPDDILQDYYVEIMEVPTGFFILGQKQKNNFHTDIFLMKTDREGTKLWEKSYGHPTRDNYYGSIVQVNENEFVIGGATTIDPVQLQAVENTSNFYVIDSLGNLKSSWQSEPSFTDIGVGFGLYQTDQAGWAYATVEGQFQSDGYFERKWSFIERDSNYNLVTRKTYGGFHNRNWVQNFKKLHNGDYLMVGSRVIHFDSTAQYPALQMGSLLRISPSGDSLWNYVDTAFALLTNTLYDAVELPSGSIIACGYGTTINPPKDWGWIIKVSKDGCVDTLNCFPVSSIPPVSIKKECKAYPNPATDFIYLEIPEFSKLDYEIFDLSGLLIKQSSQLGGRLDISRLKAGAYVLKFNQMDQCIIKKIVKI